MDGQNGPSRPKKRGDRDRTCKRLEGNITTYSAHLRSGEKSGDAVLKGTSLFGGGGGGRERGLCHVACASSSCPPPLSRFSGGPPPVDGGRQRHKSKELMHQGLYIRVMRLQFYNNT